MYSSTSKLKKPHLELSRSKASDNIQTLDEINHREHRLTVDKVSVHINNHPKMQGVTFDPVLTFNLHEELEKLKSKLQGALF